MELITILNRLPPLPGICLSPGSLQYRPQKYRGPGAVAQMAARTDCGRTLARSHGDFDALLVGTEVGVLVDKTPETMAAV